VVIQHRTDYIHYYTRRLTGRGTGQGCLTKTRGRLEWSNLQPPDLRERERFKIFSVCVYNELTAYSGPMRVNVALSCAPSLQQF